MLKIAENLLRMESDCILDLIPRLDEKFEEAVNLMLNCRGRVVVTGMGKSGIIAHKIAATMASTGTPAFFMHPAEGIHGDLGMVTAQDVILAISNSGETAELLNIFPSIRRIGAKIISMSGNVPSTLSDNSDVPLNVHVKQEACPLNLAPTTSTTAALALGDALAVALMHMRKFTSDEFAVFHPGGSLGRKLLLTVGNIMHKEDDLPLIGADKIIQEAIFVITDKGMGAALVVDEQGKLQGLLTDGDIRRALARGLEFIKQPVSELMTKEPRTITANKLAAEALCVMENNKPRPITVLPVVDNEGKVQGLLHMTDLLKQGVV